MYRKLLVIGICIACIANASACSSERVLGVDDDGSVVELALDEQIVVELASNPTTGYSWQVSESGGIQQVGEVEYTSDDDSGDRVGSGGVERFVFKRSGPEAGTLVLEYRRPWEEEYDVPAEDTWQVSFEAVD